jgi:hypothetical protein
MSRPPEATTLLAKQYGVSRRTIQRIGRYQFERMTELGRELMILVCKNEPTSVQVSAAMRRLANHHPGRTFAQRWKKRIAEIEARSAWKESPMLWEEEPTERVNRMMRLVRAA